MAKKKLPANFGPKDLSKLPAGLRAYWEKKRAAEKGKPTEKTADKPATKKTTKKAAPKKKTTAKIGVRKTTRTRLTDTKKKSDKKPKREGSNNPLIAKQLIRTRGTEKK